MTEIVNTAEMLSMHLKLISMLGQTKHLSQVRNGGDGVEGSFDNKKKKKKISSLFLQPK